MAKNYEIWTVRGIPKSVQDSVKIAAKKEGKTIGNWTLDMIQNYMQSEHEKNNFYDLRLRLASLQMTVEKQQDATETMQNSLEKIETAMTQKWTNRFFNK
jgi:hypothetical protein